MMATAERLLLELTSPPARPDTPSPAASSPIIDALPDRQTPHSDDEKADAPKRPAPKRRRIKASTVVDTVPLPAIDVALLNALSRALPDAPLLLPFCQHVLRKGCTQLQSTMKQCADWSNGLLPDVLALGAAVDQLGSVVRNTYIVQV